MAATPIVKLIYGKPMLPDLARVLACLNEREIEFELEDMNKGIRITQDILNLQLSSHGRTPLLIDGPDELFGSRNICRHVVEKYRAHGYPYLLGKDPLAKVSVEQWIKSEEHRFDPPSSTLVFFLAYKMDVDLEKATQCEKNLEKVLNLYETRLGESDFLAGNYFTLADLYHLPNTFYLQSSVEYGHLFKDRKNVSRWWKNISERNSWKNVVEKFKKEGLQFNVLVTNSETDQSSSSTRKNGIKNGPFVSSEISSKTRGVEADIRGDKGETNASGNKKEPTPNKEKKDDEAAQSKFEGQKDEISSANNKEFGANKKNKRDDITVLKDEDKDNGEATKKETTKPEEQAKSGKTNEIKEGDAKKTATEDTKETPEPADKEKLSSIDKSKLGLTDVIKERDANKPTTEAKKERPKPDDKEKASLGDKEKASLGDKEKASLGDKEKSGKTDETNEFYAKKPEGDKDAHKSDDKGKTSSDDDRKIGIIDKASTDDKEKPVKIDDIKKRDADKKDFEGKKIDENKEHKTNDAGTEGKKDGFKSDDKDKYSSGNGKERDLTKENINQDAINSDNQVKKGSAPNDGKNKTSQENNKNLSSNDGKEKTN